MNLSDFGKDVRSIVATVAPTLGTAFGGTLGGAAGTWIANKLGDGDSKKAAELIAAGDPQTLLALQKLDTDFKQHLADLGVSLDQLEFQDRADARSLAVKTGKIWIPATIAAVFIGGWFTVQYVLLFHVIPESNRDILLRTMGTLDMVLGAIVGYFFGSSAGSAQKNELFSALADKLASNDGKPG
jgi:membrane protein YqaA with SNARE-associated domain